MGDSPENNRAISQSTQVARGTRATGHTHTVPWGCCRDVPVCRCLCAGAHVCYYPRARPAHKTDAPATSEQGGHRPVSERSRRLPCVPLGRILVVMLVLLVVVDRPVFTAGRVVSRVVSLVVSSCHSVSAGTVLRRSSAHAAVDRVNSRNVRRSLMPALRCGVRSRFRCGGAYRVDNVNAVRWAVIDGVNVVPTKKPCAVMASEGGQGGGT